MLIRIFLYCITYILFFLIPQENIFNNYKNIEFFPNKFHEYLLSPEVGFSHSYALGIPRHASKGFYRPIQVRIIIILISIFKNEYFPTI